MFFHDVSINTMSVDFLFTVNKIGLTIMVIQFI